MQIQVNTDNHIEAGEGLRRHVESVVGDAMGRFGNRVIRVMVHLGDENSHKSGGADKRCAMEARLAGLQPIAVTAMAGTLDAAIDGAADKLQKSLDRTLERKDDPKGRPTVRKEPGL